MHQIDNKIKNIYYMLAYNRSFSKLNELNIEKFSTEKFNNIHNLFGYLLVEILNSELKGNIYKEYILETDSSSFIKGKILFSSIFNSDFYNKKIVKYEHDSFETNNNINKIIKFTLFILLKDKDVDNTVKKSIKKILEIMKGVDLVPLSSLNFKSNVYNKFNKSYESIINLCHLIINGLIITEDKGKIIFREFLSSSRLSYIYENFIKEYYRKHFPELNAISKRIYLSRTSIEYIPTMLTDIFLTDDDKTLIIDAKFYTSILNESYYEPNKKIINSDNINQILTYVDNQNPFKNKKVAGMLLYAQTIDEPEINSQVVINMHNIIIKTLDLNKSWEEISNQLNNIADSFKKGEYNL